VKPGDRVTHPDYGVGTIIVWCPENPQVDFDRPTGSPDGSHLVTFTGDAHDELRPLGSGSGDFSIGGSTWPGLSKLIEECGEAAELLPELILAKTIAALQVTSGKLIGSEGRTDHWSGDLRKRFVEEIGDLRAAITFFVHHNMLDDFQAIEDRTDEKVALFLQWHRDGLAGRRLDTLPGGAR
jgi:hypothetical protein